MKQISRIENITPEIARALLEKNTYNRPINQTRLRKYIKAMKDGSWVLNGESIKIAVGGRLLDGQTRLLACVMSGVAFQTWVIRNVPEEAVFTIDIGGFRKVADMHAFEGEKNTSQLGAVINLLSEIIDQHAYSSLEYEDQKAFLDRFPEIRESVTSIRLRHMNVPPCVEHAANYFASQSYGSDWAAQWLYSLSVSRFDNAQAALDVWLKKRKSTKTYKTEYSSLLGIMLKAMKWSHSGVRVPLVYQQGVHKFPEL
jgi:hypothetical protein